MIHFLLKGCYFFGGDIRVFFGDVFMVDIMPIILGNGGNLGNPLNQEAPFGYILGCPPAQDTSQHRQHQDYYICRLGNPNLNLHLPLFLAGGDNPQYIHLRVI